jgi:predicted dehydrogenase
MSAIAPLGGRSLRLSATRAGIETPGLDPQERQLAAGVRPGDEAWGAGEPARWVDAAGARTIALERGAYERFYASVRDALTGATDMPVDPRDSVAALRVIEAARRSAQTAATISTTQEEGS